MIKLRLILFLFLPLGLYAQATDSTKTRPRRVEFGLNITNTLTSVFGSTNSVTSDPYLLSLRWGRFDYRRWRLGLDFRVRYADDFDGAFFIEEKTSTANLRLGHEWVFPVSRRFAYYAGIDGVFDLQLENIQTDGGFGSAELKSERWGFGGGPVLGIQWRVHPRVALTTESSIYALYHTGFEEVNAPPDVRREPVGDFEFRPLIPSSLFIHFAF